MGFATIRSRAQIGVSAPPVSIEVYLAGGLPTFSIVGLGDAAVRESRDRVTGAIESSGFRMPQERTIVSLAPADMRKTGSRFDVAIALGLLVASRQVDATEAARYEYYGELALSGEIRAVPGILPATLRAQEEGAPVFVPLGNAEEALLAHEAVFAAASLGDLAAHLNGVQVIGCSSRIPSRRHPPDFPDLADVRGQQQARRALEIAAAGGHNLLMVGPPGTGKSMLAERLPGILPPLSGREAIESAAVASILGRQLDEHTFRMRPFRSPHHTASAVALVGGGSDPRPGEVSLAHNGVLFLDELPEFGRRVLDVLREPMETGVITISRASRQADFPARFQLVAAMNPCPCGYLGDPQGDCRCSADRVANYRSKVSGPLLDRIDIRIHVQRPSPACLRPDAPLAEESRRVRRRVTEALAVQSARQGCRNATLAGRQLHSVCNADPSAWAIMEAAMDRFAMSVRAHQRVWRVARTIADLRGGRSVQAADVGEALTLRFDDARSRSAGQAERRRLTAPEPGRP